MKGYGLFYALIMVITIVRNSGLMGEWQYKVEMVGEKSKV